MLIDQLHLLFDNSLKHRAEHQCGSYPYEHADVLSVLITATQAKKVLELGTGLGYSAAVMASANREVHIDTIDKDSTHADFARRNWEELKVQSQITLYMDKAEEVLSTLQDKSYDIIFFDGYVPSMKFLLKFEKLLKKGGILITANMFLRDENGGKHMRALQKRYRWQTAVFADTTIAVKLFE